MIHRAGTPAVLGLLCLSVLVPAAHAQTTATIAGVVRDESRAVLPGATVTITNLETTVTHTLTTDTQGRFDTLPSLIRHGQSEMRFTFANSTQTPATLRLTLFDPSGTERGRYEQLLPAQSQREWSLAELFNVQKMRGAMRFVSDVPIAVSAQRVTRILRDEPFRSEFGYVDVAALRQKQEVELPEVSDGAGVATEILLINPLPTTSRAQLRFTAASGEPAAVILR